MPKIGVLAIQGDFLEHQRSLGSLGCDSPEIRLPDQLDDIDGLIIPGGESTTIVQLIDIYNFREPLVEKVKSGLPVWGSCAGMIVLANQLADKRPEPLHLMNIEVSRNAFGRQIDSFEEDLDIYDIDGSPFRAVFIRAPLVTKIGKDVDAVFAEELGLVTFIPDDIDWEDEVRIAVEERASFSPDALTGMEASLRFAGPETLETKIFGRLTAWQNWIFQRPNAVGEQGALKLYGTGKQAGFDKKRV